MKASIAKRPVSCGESRVRRFVAEVLNTSLTLVTLYSGSDHVKTVLAKERVVIIGHFTVLEYCFRPGNGPFNDDRPVHPLLRASHDSNSLLGTPDWRIID